MRWVYIAPEGSRLVLTLLYWEPREPGFRADFSPVGPHPVDTCHRIAGWDMVQRWASDDAFDWLPGETVKTRYLVRGEGARILVYWNTAALRPQDDADNPTAPFSTAEYDATALLRCRAAGATDFGQCPAGILRMEDGQASIVVQNPAGEQFTINFMTDYVNATNRELRARLEGDTWILEFANGEVWEVPLAAIEGG